MRDESAQSVIWLQINESLIPISPRSVSHDAAPGQVLPWATITLGATWSWGERRDNIASENSSFKAPGSVELRVMMLKLFSPCYHLNILCHNKWLSRTPEYRHGRGFLNPGPVSCSPMPLLKTTAHWAATGNTIEMKIQSIHVNLYIQSIAFLCCSTQDWIN